MYIAYTVLLRFFYNFYKYIYLYFLQSHDNNFKNDSGLTHGIICFTKTNLFTTRVYIYMYNI